MSKTKTKKKHRGRVDIPALRPFTYEEMRRARGVAYRVGYELGKELVESKTRRICTVCGTPAEWYRLEPGSGRCIKCQP